MENTPVFDKKDLMERLDEDMELAKELVALFMDDTTEKIRQMGAAIEEKNFGEIEKQAHSLKGAAANISAYRVRELADQIEAAGKTRDADAARSGYDDLVPAIGELSEVLKIEILAA